MSLVNFQNVCRDHVGRMRPEHVRTLMNSPGIVIPLLLIHKGAHVIADTQDFLHRQLQILGEQYDRFITMSLEQRIGLILPAAFIDGTKFRTCRRVERVSKRMSILVLLTNIMEHADDVRGFGTLPLQVIIVGERVTNAEVTL